MCLYLFLLCIVFACEVCTVMVNNNNNRNDKLNSFSRQLLQSLKQVILLELSRTFTVKKNYGKDSFN